MGVEQAQEHFARAPLQRSQPGQNGSARHAGCAAQDQHLAMAAFVALVGFGSERSGRDQPGIWRMRWACWVGQIIEPHFAGCIFALVGEQTWLEGQQAQSCQWEDPLGARYRAQPLAAVRHQTGGHIHAQQWGWRLTQQL